MGTSTDQLTPNSDEWWIDRLSRKLSKDGPRIETLRRWQAGDPPLDYKADAEKEVFQKFLKMARINIAPHIVNTMLSRMQPLAFKTAQPGDENGDLEAYKIMNRCDLPVVFSEILEWSSVFGRSYGLVSKVKGKAWVTPEHPSQVIAERDPVTREVIAALKIYRDEMFSRDVAVLYRPGYQRESYHYGETTVLPDCKNITWYVDRDSWKLQDPVKTGIAGVPVIPFGTGVGEFEAHLDSLGRINHTLLQRMVVIAYQAFKQRGIKGVPNKNEKGEEIDYSDVFTTDPGALWLLPKDAEIWESTQAEVTGILSAVKDDIKDLAVESATPLYSISPDAANGSAEGASLQRETHVFKVEDRIRRYKGSVNLLMSVVFEMEGDTKRANRDELTSVWMDPVRSSLTERAASAAQAAQAGLPWRYVMSHYLKLTPEEIADAERDRRKDQLREAANAAPAAGETGRDAAQPDAANTADA